MITLRFFMMLAVFAVGLQASALAGYHVDCKINERGGPWEAQMSAKITRGITNTLYGWTELVRTPVGISECAPTMNAAKTLAIGIPYGIVRMVGRTVIGVYEVATFYAPQGPLLPSIQGDVI